MANIKITDLSNFADPNSTDVLPIVDVANDETKKVSIGNLMKSAVAGTAALPGVAFAVDADTGMYRNASDQLAFATGGVERILIDDSGVVTIAGDLTVNGTTTTIDSTTLTVEDKNIELGVVDTPSDTTADGGGITLKGATDKTINWVNATDAWTSSERFDFPAGTAAAPSIILNGDVNSGLYQPGADQVAISTGGSARLYIAADGDIGVGTTNPAALLECRTTGTTDASYEIQRWSTTNGGILGILVDQTQANPTWTFRSATSEPIAFQQGSSESLRIDSDGKLLVGVSSSFESAAGALLQIKPSASNTTPVISLMRNDTTITNNNNLGQLAFYSDDGTPVKTAHISAAASQDHTSTARGTDLTFSTTEADTADAPTERMRIDADGRLLVGTPSNTQVSTIVAEGNSGDSTGAAVLYLNNGDTTVGDGSSFGLIRFADSSSVTAAQIAAQRDGGTWTSESSQPSRLTFSTTADGASSPTERMRISANGNITVDTDTFFVDAVNDRVGVGTTTVDSLLHLQSSDATAFDATATDGQVGVGPTVYLENPANANNTVGGQIVFGMRGTEEQARISATGGTSPELVFTTANAQRMVIDNSGNVGVGTTSPAVDGIHIRNSNETVLRLDHSTTNTWDISNDSNLKFSRGGTERARIDNLGRFMVGTNTTIGVGADNRDTIQGVATAGGGLLLGRNDTETIESNNIGKIEFWGNDSNGTYELCANIIAEADAAHATGDKPTRITFGTTADGESTPTERMRIDSSGNVGIGQDDPQTRLHIYAADPILRIQDSSTSIADGFAALQLAESGADGVLNNYWQIALEGDSGTSTDHLTFKDGTGERMRIDSSGRLLVGASSAVNQGTSVLIQAAASNGAGLVLGRNDTTVAAGEVMGQILFAGNDSNGTYQTCAAIQCRSDLAHDNNDKPSALIFRTTADGGNSATERMRISNSGNVGIGTDFTDTTIANKTGLLNIHTTNTGTHNGVTLFWDHNNQTTDIEQRIQFALGDDASADNYQNAGYIAIGKEDTWQGNGERSSYLAFGTSSAASQGERARITKDGYFKINTTQDTDARFTVREGNSGVWTKLELSGGSMSNYHMAIVSGRWMTRALSETSMDLVKSRTGGTNINQSVRVEFFLNSAVNNDMGVVVGYAGCHKAGGNYTYWTTTPTITQINGTGYGAGTLTWEGTGNDRTLRYTTDSNTNYTKYMVKEMVLTGHDNANFEIL